MTATRVTTSSQRRISVAIRLLIWQKKRETSSLDFMLRLDRRVQYVIRALFDWSVRHWSASLSSWYTASSHFCHSSSSLGQRIPCEANQERRSEACIGVFVLPGCVVWWHSLVWNDLEHQVVQQSELLCNFHCWVILEGLSFPSSHLKDTNSPKKQ